jgi:hypothetical protein
MSSGKARVVTKRRVVDGLTLTVSSRGVGLRLVAAIRFSEPAVGVDMLLIRSNNSWRCKVSHGLF